MPCLDITTVNQLYFEYEITGGKALLRAKIFTTTWVLQTIIRWAKHSTLLLQGLQIHLFFSNLKPTQMAEKTPGESPLNGAIELKCVVICGGQNIASESQNSCQKAIVFGCHLCKTQSK